jgi:hypothetical protein
MQPPTLWSVGTTKCGYTFGILELKCWVRSSAASDMGVTRLDNQHHWNYGRTLNHSLG